MEESVFSQSPFSSDSSSSHSASNGSSSRRGKKLLFLIILLVILGLIAFGAVKFLGGSVLNGGTPTPTPTIIAEPTPTDTPTPTPEVSGTPTPSPKATPTTTAVATPTKAAGTTTGGSVDKTTGIDRATITVAVQNGSGVSGAAKKAGDVLTTAGYTLGTVGNAETSDFAQTEIHVKAGKASLLSLLKKDLSTDYTIGTSASDYTGAGDALVIVGKE